MDVETRIRFFFFSTLDSVDSKDFISRFGRERVTPKVA
jgi:hypothetical protein